MLQKALNAAAKVELRLKKFRGVNVLTELIWISFPIMRFVVILNLNVVYYIYIYMGLFSLYLLYAFMHDSTKLTLLNNIFVF